MRIGFPKEKYMLFETLSSGEMLMRYENHVNPVIQTAEFFIKIDTLAFRMRKNDYGDDEIVHDIVSNNMALDLSTGQIYEFKQDAKVVLIDGKFILEGYSYEKF